MLGYIIFCGLIALGAVGFGKKQESPEDFLIILLSPILVPIVIGVIMYKLIEKHYE